MGRTYKILSNVDVGLKRVTLRAIKFYKDNKFFEDNLQANGEFFDFLVTPKLIEDWCNNIFILSQEQRKIISEQIEDLDFEELFEAHTDFFIKLNPPLKKLVESVRNLDFSIPKTTS
jgi:hypothetical protein